MLHRKEETLTFLIEVLSKEFGKPRKVMRELLRETLPEEEYDRLKQIQSRFLLDWPLALLS